MKKYLPIAASVLLLAACSEKPGYEITGTVSNSDLNGKYVYLYEYGDKRCCTIGQRLSTKRIFCFERHTKRSCPPYSSVFRKKWLNRCVSLPEKTLRSWQHSYLKTEN